MSASVTSCLHVQDYEFCDVIHENLKSVLFWKKRVSVLMKDWINKDRVANPDIVILHFSVSHFFLVFGEQYVGIQ